jgi:hypothetical protein
MNQLINILVTVTLIEMMVAVGLSVTFTDLLGVARTNFFVNGGDVERKDRNAHREDECRTTTAGGRPRGPSALAGMGILSL